MDDQGLMSIVNGLTNCLEQAKPLGNRESVLETVFGDRLAGDPLHHQVTLAFRQATVNHPDNIGMIERGEYAPFGNEAPLSLGRKQPPSHQLHGHIAMEFAVTPARAIYPTHSAVAEFVDDTQGTDPVPNT